MMNFHPSSTPEGIRARITEIITPAINPQAPYAKIMIGYLVDVVTTERDNALKKLLRQIEATLPGDLMIVVDLDGNYAIAKRD